MNKIDDLKWTVSLFCYNTNCAFNVEGATCDLKKMSISRFGECNRKTDFAYHGSSLDKIDDLKHIIAERDATIATLESGPTIVSIEADTRERNEKLSGEVEGLLALVDRREEELEDFAVKVNELQKLNAELLKANDRLVDVNAEKEKEIRETFKRCMELEANLKDNSAEGFSLRREEKKHKNEVDYWKRVVNERDASISGLRREKTKLEENRDALDTEARELFEFCSFKDKRISTLKVELEDMASEFNRVRSDFAKFAETKEPNADLLILLDDASRPLCALKRHVNGQEEIDATDLRQWGDIANGCLDRIWKATHRDAGDDAWARLTETIAEGLARPETVAELKAKLELYTRRFEYLKSQILDGDSLFGLTMAAKFPFPYVSRWKKDKSFAEEIDMRIAREEGDDS